MYSQRKHNVHALTLHCNYILQRQVAFIESNCQFYDFFLKERKEKKRSLEVCSFCWCYHVKCLNLLNLIFQSLSFAKPHSSLFNQKLNIFLISFNFLHTILYSIPSTYFFSSKCWNKRKHDITTRFTLTPLSMDDNTPLRIN